MTTHVKFKAPDLAEATVSIKTFEDQDHGLNVVRLSLPAGMDIGPDIWRYERAHDAEMRFNLTLRQVAGYGFKEVARETR